MRKNFYALIIGLFATATMYAQQHEPCASDHVLEQQIQTNPGRLQELNQLESHIQQYLQRNPNQRSSGVITIPVVVHVVYKTSAENISDSQVYSQIQILNEDFRRLNDDAGNTITEFQGVAADAEIQFCLATTDPNGNPTTGITRTLTWRDQWCYNSSCGMWYDIMYSSSGGIDAWPRTDYMNLWIGNLEGSYLGWATYPGSSGPTTHDGVVCDYTTIGRPPYNPNSGGYNRGRTATHEVGHWLNLRHIWGHNTGCSGDDDLVDDTPFHDSPNYSCNLTKVSCNSLDMVQNYMDYTNNYCMNLFTEGQKQRMRAILASGGPRHSLLSSQGCSGQYIACNAPTGMSTTSIGNNAATLNWDTASGAQSYNIRYRATGTSTWNTASTTATSYTASNLQVCTGYEWQVQTVCTGSSSNFSASTSFTTTGCETQACDAPTGQSTSNIGNNSATLNWNASSGAQSYNVRHRVTGTSTWSSANTTGTNYSIGTLQSCTGYEWQVQTVCSGSTSNFSPSSSFTTTGCESQTCDAPGNIAFSYSGNTVTMTWDPVIAATSYEVGIKKRNSWSTTTTTETFINIGGMKPGQSFDWRIRSICSNGNSEYVTGTYTVPDNTSGGGGPGNNGNGGGPNKMANGEMKLFPNPASTQATLLFGNMEETTLSIEVTDISGRRVFVQHGIPSTFGAIDISTIDWHQGVYLIRVMDATGIHFNQKLVITR